MASEFISNYINAALSAYLDDISSDKIRLSFFDSKCNIDRVALYKFALFQHGIPLVIDQSVIKNITMNIPWTSFLSDPVKIRISDVFIKGRFVSANSEGFPTKEEIMEMKDREIMLFDRFVSKFETLLKLFSPSWFKSTYLTIMSHIQIVIERVNIVFDHGMYSMGVQIEEIKVGDPGASSDPDMMIDRAITMSGVGFYLDYQRDHMNNLESNLFEQSMMNLMAQAHDWIAEPFSFDGRIYYSGEAQKIQVVSNLETLVLNIRENQLNEFQSLALDFASFVKFWFMRTVPKPSNDDSAAMWMYLNECALSTRNFGNSPKEILKRLRQRKLYQQLSKSPQTDSDKDFISYINHSVPYEALLYIRNIGKGLRQKWGNLHIKRSQIKGFTDLCSLDPRLLLSLVLVQLNLDITVNEIEINLAGFHLTIPSLNVGIISGDGVHTLFARISTFSLKKNNETVISAMEPIPEAFSFDVIIDSRKTPAVFSLVSRLSPKKLNVNLKYLGFTLNWSVLMDLINYIPRFPKVDINILPTDICVELDRTASLILSSDYITVATPVENLAEFSLYLVIGGGRVALKKRVDSKDVIKDIVRRVDVIFDIRNGIIDSRFGSLKVLFDWTDALVLKDAVSKIGLEHLMSSVDQGLVDRIRTLVYIPNVDVSLFIPHLENPVKMVIKNINMESKGYNATASIDEINLGDWFCSTQMKTKIENNKMEITMKSGKSGILEAISFLPKDLFHHVKYCFPPIPFTIKSDVFSMDTKMGTTSLYSEMIDFEGSCDGTALRSTALMATMDINGDTILKDTPIVFAIGFDEDFYIEMQYKEATMLTSTTSMEGMMNMEADMKAYFPDLMKFKWIINFDILDIAGLGRFDLNLSMLMDQSTFQVSAQTQKMDLYIGEMKGTNPFSFSADMLKKAIDIQLNFDSVLIDVIKAMKFVDDNHLSSLNIDKKGSISITSNRIDAMLVYGPHRIQSILALNAQYSFDTSTINVSIDSLMLKYCDKKILEVPSIMVNGINCINAIVKSPKVTVFLNDIIEVSKILKTLPLTGNMQIPPLKSIVSDAVVAIRSGGPDFVEIASSETVCYFNDGKLSFKTDYTLSIVDHEFQRKTIQPESSISIQHPSDLENHKSDILLDKFVISTSSDDLVRVIQSMAQIMSPSNPFRLINQLNIEVTWKGVTVPPHASYFCYDYPGSIEDLQSEELEHTLYPPELRDYVYTSRFNGSLSLEYSNCFWNETLLDIEIIADGQERFLKPLECIMFEDKSTLKIKVDDSWINVLERSSSSLAIGNNQLCFHQEHTNNTTGERITLKHMMISKNILEVPVEVSLNGREYQSIFPGTQLPIQGFRNEQEAFVFFIKIPEFRVSQEVVVHPQSQVFLKTKKSIFIETIEIDHSLTLFIKPSLKVINNSYDDLYVSTTSHQLKVSDKLGRGNSVSLFSASSSTSILRIGYHNAPVILQKELKIPKNKDTQVPFDLPVSSGVTMPLLAEVSSDSGTTNVYIKPRVCVRNMTTSNLVVKATATDHIHIIPGQLTYIPKFNENHLLSIEDQTFSGSKLLELSGRLISVEYSQGGNLITFYDEPLQSDTRVINQLEEEIKIGKNTVTPGSTLIIEQETFQLEIEDKVLQVDKHVLPLLFDKYIVYNNRTDLIVDLSAKERSKTPKEWKMSIPLVSLNILDRDQPKFGVLVNGIEFVVDFQGVIPTFASVSLKNMKAQDGSNSISLLRIGSDDDDISSLRIVAQDISRNFIDSLLFEVSNIRAGADLRLFYNIYTQIRAYIPSSVPNRIKIKHFILDIDDMAVAARVGDLVLLHPTPLKIERPLLQIESQDGLTLKNFIFSMNFKSICKTSIQFASNMPLFGSPRKHFHGFFTKYHDTGIPGKIRALFYNVLSMIFTMILFYRDLFTFCPDVQPHTSSLRKLVPTLISHMYIGILMMAASISKGDSLSSYTLGAAKGILIIVSRVLLCLLEIILSLLNPLVTLLHRDIDDEK